MKRILLLILLCMGTLAANAQGKAQTVSINVSIYCDHCKQCESCGKRLEEAVYTEKGVKRVDIDEAKKTVTIVYNPTKTNPDKLRQAIAAVGFNADNIPGNPNAYAEWDGCCKKGE